MSNGQKCKIHKTKQIAYGTDYPSLGAMHLELQFDMPVFVLYV